MIEVPSPDQANSPPAATDAAAADSGKTTANPTRTISAIGGLAAGAAALGIGELVGAARAPEPGPVVAVANRVIDLAPTWFVELGKSVFGLADKPALIVGTIVFSAVFAALLGLAARRSLALACLGFVAFGLLGATATATDAQGSTVGALLTAGAATWAGVGALVLLTRRSRRHRAADTVAPLAIEDPQNPNVDRRSFLTWAGGTGAAAAGAALAARSLRSRTSVQEARTAVALEPEIDDEVQDWLNRAAEAGLDVGDELTPLVVEEGEFYLIDTALVKPQVDPATWSLRIGGMVDSPLEITYDELLERSTTVAPVTLSCVSNEVGGGLVGNAIWQGVPLIDLLNEAGIQAGASQVASRSIDGWTCGFPTEVLTEDRTALVAVSMNGEPLPVQHGFPARLVVSGLYGYVSATKWLTDIELTTLDGFNGYWIPRGWSKLGPVKTQSRIDTPRRRSTVVAGEPMAVAGVAWAPDTGITKVEVSIDGEWVEASLSEEIGVDAWRQWMVSWTPEAGDHVLAVRATDASGYTQTSDLAPPAPNGATGWHTIEVQAQ